MKFMKAVKEVMTENPRHASPYAKLDELARIMKEADCGEIPICDGFKLVGVVTDRDIVLRAVAEGMKPEETFAREIMTEHVITVRPDTDVSEAVELMERQEIHRLPVVDRDGKIRGMLSVADLAHHLSERKVGEVVRQLSHPRKELVAL